MPIHSNSYSMTQAELDFMTKVPILLRQIVKEMEKLNENIEKMNKTNEK